MKEHEVKVKQTRTFGRVFVQVQAREMGAKKWHCMKEFDTIETGVDAAVAEAYQYVAKLKELAPGRFYWV